MGKKLPYTPNSRIRSALRQLWLRSRERAATLKRDNYSCVRCGVKQSRKKGVEVYVEVHHRHGVTNWEALFSAIREHLLCNESEMETLCPKCHKKEE